MTELERRRIPTEVEMRLVDAQAVDRRIALKRRDSGIAVVVPVVPDTNRNRGVLAVHREALRSSFPLDTRAVLRSMAVGLAPAASGIVVV